MTGVQTCALPILAVFFAGKVDEFEGVGDDTGDFVFSGSYDFQGEGYVIVDGFLLEFL